MPAPLVLFQRVVPRTPVGVSEKGATVLEQYAELESAQEGFSCLQVNSSHICGCESGWNL